MDVIIKSIIMDKESNKKVKLTLNMPIVNQVPKSITSCIGPKKSLQKKILAAVNDAPTA